MAHLLVVDDEPSISWAMKRLAEDLGHRATTVATAEEGLRLIDKSRPDVIVLDVRLPGMDGLSAMSHFQDRCDRVPIIVITAYGDLDTAVDAVRRGAFEYLVKPFDLETAQRTILRALESQAVAAIDLGEKGSEPADQIVGTSPVMQHVFKQIALAAPSETSVHLVGESGTGKELIARAIHRHSRRASAPFVPVNLASLSLSLAESELFGHVRGAFTGAETDHRGLLERAGGGTIFFDEVADVPLPLQVKLLRALEQAEVVPVGATDPVRTDFRVISATHRDLRQLIAEGRFRHDLYYRLVAFEINVPPLSDRSEDIPALAAHFLSLLARRGGVQRPVLSQEALDALRQRSWRGNVRELRNTIEHALILARGGVILTEHLPASLIETSIETETDEGTIAESVARWTRGRLTSKDEANQLYDRLLAIVEPPLVREALAAFGGQHVAAARALGIHRTTLKKKADQFAVQPDVERS